jgi:hypothetical protein
MLCAGVMELADVSDSKSDGSDTVPVRPRSPAPGEQVLVSRACFFISVLILFCFCFTTKSIGDDLGLKATSDELKRPSESSEPAERKTNRLKRKDLRSACVSKSQTFVSYSVSKGYAVIVARAIMMIWTCAERFAGVTIDYGRAAHINIVP